MIIGPIDEPDDDSPTDELPTLAERDVVDLEASSALTLAEDGAPLAPGLPSSTGRFPLPDGLPEVESFPEPATDAAPLRRRIELLEATIDDKDAEIASLAERLRATREAVARRDETERQLRAQLENGTPELQQLITRLEEAEWLAAQYADRVAELTSRLRTFEQASDRRDSAFAELEAELIAREARVVERERALSDGSNGSSIGAIGMTAAGESTLSTAQGDASAADGQDASPAADRARRSPTADRDLAAQAADSERSSPATDSERSSPAADPAAAPLAAKEGDAPPALAEGDAPPALAEGDAAPALAAALEQSREEAAALAAYVDCRRAHWLALEAQLEEQRTRLRALEHEMHQHGERERLATERADAERRRADALDAELARMRASTDWARMPSKPPVSAATIADRAAHTPAASAASSDLAANVFAAASREHPAVTLGATLGATLGDHRPRTDAAGDFAASLLCLTSDPPREHRLTDTPTLVGRGSHCDIRIATHFVSREHARIVREGDQVMIEDLGSRNGVFVNAVRVDRDALRHGDLVTIGDTQFRVEIHGAPLSA